MLGWDRERLTLRFLAAPLFYGHASSCTCAHPTVPASKIFGAALSENGLEPGEERGPLVSTPMEVADERTIRLGELSADGLGGFGSGLSPVGATLAPPNSPSTWPNARSS